MSINANNAALNEILKAINELPEAGSGKEEVEKIVDIIKNGETVVTPDDENTTLSKVTINVTVPEQKEEQEKIVDITENGTTEVTPDKGKALSKVTVNVTIEGSGGYSLEDIVTGTEPSGDIVIGAVTPRQNVFTRCNNITSLTFIGTIFSSANSAGFNYLGNCKSITFKNTQGTTPALMCSYNSKCEIVKFIGTNITDLSSNFFNGLGNSYGKPVIYVPWAEGEVDNAPWGATKATIHYNTTYDADDNPIVMEGE